MRSFRNRVVATATTGLSGQKRSYEYWGLHVGPRTQPACLGDELPALHNNVGATSLSVEAQSLTGNNLLPAYDMELFQDHDRHFNILKRQENWYPNIDKYKVPEVDSAYCVVVSDLLENLSSAHKEAIFEALLKDYPRLVTPMQPDVQEEFLNFFQEMSNIVHDPAKASTYAEPFMLRFYETKFISAHYWWRIAEKIMNELETVPGVRSFEKRAIRLVIEAVTKTTINTLANQPWASDELTNAYYHDICGHRVVHEAGFW